MDVKNKNRVVITGMGAISPNGIGIEEFYAALSSGRSGIKFIEEMKELGFRSHVGGLPQLTDKQINKVIPEKDLKRMSSAMINGAMAAHECWYNAKLGKICTQNEEPLWDTGCIIGTTVNGVEVFVNDVGPAIHERKIRRMGINAVEKTMGNGISSKVAGIFGLGNKVSANSSACATGGEAILDAYFHILSGRADAMFCGGASGSAPYIWSGFDAMRMLTSSFNDTPEKASRPFSSNSSNFVAGQGAAVLYIEKLDRALARNAQIYAEIIGGSSNSGGQRQGGTMTAPNSIAVRKCIRDAMKNSGINSNDVDYINGHVTGTMADELELENWKEALELEYDNFPIINSTKAMIGHALGAAGALELAATVLQLHHQFIHPAINSEDLAEKIKPFRNSIPLERIDKKISIAMKSSFGFGDVNTVLVLKRWDE